MPDLVTHLAVNHLLRNLTEIRQESCSAPERVLFYAGTLLPDVTSRSIAILFPASITWTLAFHTPAGSIILAVLFSQFMKSGTRNRSFCNIAAGSLLHYLLDTFQKTSTPVFFWLFPFSWKDCGIPLFDPGDLIPWIPVWLVILLVWEGLRIFVKSKRPAANSR